MLTKKHGCKRMCICCKTISPKSDLLKFVCDKNGQIVFDVEQICEGRGAFLCKNRQCIHNTFSQRKGFERAFKQKIVGNAELVCESVLKSLATKQRSSISVEKKGVVALLNRRINSKSDAEIKKVFRLKKHLRAVSTLLT